MLPVVCTSLCSGAWEQWIKAILNGRTIWMKRGGGSIDENLCNTCWYTSSSLSRLMIAVTITRWAWGWRDLPPAPWNEAISSSWHRIWCRCVSSASSLEPPCYWHGSPENLGMMRSLWALSTAFIWGFLLKDEQHLFWSQFVTTRYLEHLLKAAIWSV